MQEIAKKDINITNFPSRLRRVAEIMTNSIKFYSLKKACELANVNYDSARTMINFKELVIISATLRNREGKFVIFISFLAISCIGNILPVP